MCIVVVIESQATKQSKYAIHSGLDLRQKGGSHISPGDYIKARCRFLLSGSTKLLGSNKIAQIGGHSDVDCPITYLH